MIELIIKNGDVVLPEGIKRLSILVSDGKIEGLLSGNFLPEARQVVDASGKYVLPGLIDNHVHFNFPSMGTISRDDFYTGTRAAAFGGITTVIDFAVQKRGQSLVQAVDDKRAEGDGISVIDFAVHPTPTDVTPQVLSEIKKVIDDGAPSFNVFMAYHKSDHLLDSAGVLKVIHEVSQCGGLMGAHNETVSITKSNVADLLDQGQKSYEYFPVSKPRITEAECLHRALFMCQWEKAPFFEFHLSIKEGVELIRQKKAQGMPVYAETCTHYLVLTDDVYQRSDGYRFACNPPVRKKDDIEALWQGLANGTISVVSSDECSFDTSQKVIGKDSFDLIPNGLPTHEARLPILYSKGVVAQRITLARLVEITSTNPAKLFGLYPQKGVIAVGADADLVIFDPEIERIISHQNLHINVDWSPFEGMKVKGYPVMTICRGKVVTDGDDLVGKKGWGQFLKRCIAPQILKCASVW